MTTATLTADRSATLVATLQSVFSSFSLALRYKALFQMNDAELAARGLSRADLSQSFIDEAAKL